MPDTDTSNSAAFFIWAAACAYALALLGLSVMPPGTVASELTSEVPGRHITRHIAGYGVFTLLLCAALRSRGRVALVCIQAFFIAALFGAAVEALQLGIDYRNACWLDIKYNAAGALAGSSLWLLLSRFSGAEPS